MLCKISLHLLTGFYGKWDPGRDRQQRYYDCSDPVPCIGFVLSRELGSENIAGIVHCQLNVVLS